MRFVGSESLGRTLGGGGSPGANERLARALVAEQARHAVAARRHPRSPRPPKELLERPRRTVRMPFGRVRQRMYGTER